METENNQPMKLVGEWYQTYHHDVFLYIYYKIGCSDDAEDLAQDAFVRLIECCQMVRQDTVKHLIFTIARNLVFDYLRRYYKRQEIDSYMFETAETSSNYTESRILADDLEACEQRKLRLLPPQRQKVYELSRYEDMSVTDISDRLNLSVRTVENHLRLGRKEVRDFIRLCI